MQRTSISQLMIGFTIAFVLLVGIGVLGYQENTALVRDADTVSQTHQVTARLATLMGAVDTADIGVQLIVATQAPDTATRVHAALDRIAPALAELRTLTADNPDQQQRLEQLEPLLRTHVANLEAVLNGADPSMIQPALKTDIDTLIRTMEQDERQLLNARITQSLVSEQRTQLLIISGSLLGLLIGLVTIIICIHALRVRDSALGSLALLNSQLDTRVQQQTAALRIANNQLTALSHQLLLTQEVERGSVAVTLHEAIGQEIAALQLDLQILDDLSSDPLIHTQLNKSMTAIDRVLDQIRSLSADLRPAALDDFGMVEAIRTSAEQLAADANLAITIQAAPLHQRPPAAIETACFRIEQEAIALLSRSPGIRALHIRITKHTNAFELAICGQGIAALDEQQSVLTLLEIRERAAAAGGTISIDCTNEPSTCIIAHFPFAIVVNASSH